MKKLLNSPLLQMILGRVIGAYMWLVGATTRWEVVNSGVADALRAKGGPVVLCFWHGRIMLAHTGWIGPGGAPPTSILISQSREGDVIAYAARTVGVDVIRGSKEKTGKSKGAFEAMRAMMRHLKSGGAICITPDGPKGPRMRAEMGAIQLAKLSGAPLVGMAWSKNHSKVFSSWDRFVLSRPFGRGAFVFGEPQYVPRHADDAAMEAARAALEAELIRITQDADRRVGAVPIEPAEAALAPPALAEAPAA